MQTFFGILSFFSFVALIVGLIKPRWIRLKDRKMVVACCGLGFIVMLLTAAVVTPIYGKLWGVLAFLSVAAIIAGMINPSLLRIKSKKKAVVYYATGFVIFIAVGGIVVSVHNGNLNGLTAAAPTQPVVPQTSQQKLQAAVQSALPPSWTLGGISIASDTFYGETRPTGSQYVEVDITVGDFWDDTSLITETGQLSTNVFQQVFQADPTFYDVSIKYEGPTTDQYGNTTTNEMFDYEMDRPLYSEINWSGLSAVQNDVHMCAFLREQRVETDAVDNGRNIACEVVQYDVQQAESAIETQNAAQYPDIQQNGE